MRILICTIMRDVVEHPNWENVGNSPLEGYFRQAEVLEQCLQQKGHTFRYSIFENDSMDETPQYVSDWLKERPGSVFKSMVMGMPRFRSLPAQNTQERIEGLAAYRNHTLQAYDGEDWVLFLEADILYRGDVIQYLLAGEHGDIRTPLSFSHPHDLTSFYDPLSTRDLQGNKYRWSWPPPPNDADMVKCIKGHPIEVSTSFNCFCLVRGKIIADGVQFSYNEGESEASSFCNEARAKGYRIFVYPSIRYSVVHPLAQHAWNESMP